MRITVVLLRSLRTVAVYMPCTAIAAEYSVFSRLLEQMFPFDFADFRLRIKNDM